MTALVWHSHSVDVLGLWVHSYRHTVYHTWLSNICFTLFILFRVHCNWSDIFYSALYLILFPYNFRTPVYHFIIFGRMEGDSLDGVKVQYLNRRRTPLPCGNRITHHAYVKPQRTRHNCLLLINIISYRSSVRFSSSSAVTRHPSSEAVRVRRKEYPSRMRRDVFPAALAYIAQHIRLVLLGACARRREYY